MCVGVYFTPPLYSDIQIGRILYIKYFSPYLYDYKHFQNFVDEIKKKNSCDDNDKMVGIVHETFLFLFFFFV